MSVGSTLEDDSRDARLTPRMNTSMAARVTTSVHRVFEITNTGSLRPEWHDPEAL